MCLTCGWHTHQPEEYLFEVVSKISNLIFCKFYVDYVTTLGKPVASRYADGLFPQYKRAQDGSVYNVSVADMLTSLCT